MSSEQIVTSHHKSDPRRWRRPEEVVRVDPDVIRCLDFTITIDTDQHE